MKELFSISVNQAGFEGKNDNNMEKLNSMKRFFKNLLTIELIEVWNSWSISRFFL